MSRLFVGSSHFCPPGAGRNRQGFGNEFFGHWHANTRRGVPPETRIAIVCEAGSRLPEPYPQDVEVVHLTGDLGHVSHLENKTKPHEFAAWTAHMCALAMLAYCDEADFLYKESDCLAFGPWLETMYRDLGTAKIIFGHAQATSPCMPSSQSLFLVKHDWIPTFVSNYLGFGGDAKIFGEFKFVQLEYKFGPQVVKRLSFPGDRERPIRYDLPVSYWQQIYPAELAEIQRRNLL